MDAPLSRAALAADLRRRVFPSPARGRVLRIGAEVELIPVDVRTRRQRPLHGSDGATLPMVRGAGATRGWREECSPASGTSEFHLPGGGRITFEPGGQIEFSSPPCCTGSALLRSLEDVMSALCEAASDHGTDLLFAGIEPMWPVDEVMPQLPGERYRRMLDYFDGIGPAGARMMRQTASMQLCVDGGEEPARVWRVLNAMAPVVAAIFANSPRHEGEQTGFASYRRHVWDTLDPRRTGLLGASQEAVDEYLCFALDAPAFLVAHDGSAPRFGELVARGLATTDDWRTHLSTLFPEVRPRGYFELRSADAVAPEWHAAPIALVCGVIHCRDSLLTVGELLGAPRPELLERAGRHGLRDPELASLATALCDLALAGCEALGEACLEEPDLNAARAFFDRYTRQARSPGDDWRGPDAWGHGSAEQQGTEARPA